MIWPFVLLLISAAEQHFCLWQHDKPFKWKWQKKKNTRSAHEYVLRWVKVLYVDQTTCIYCVFRVKDMTDQNGTVVSTRGQVKTKIGWKPNGTVKCHGIHD